MWEQADGALLERARRREPEIVELMRLLGDSALRPPDLRDTLAPAWPAITAAARERRG